MISILHLASLSFCFLQIDNYNSLEHTKSRTTLLFFYHIWYSKLSILQPLICFVRDITFSPSSLMKNDYVKQKISLENLKVKMYIDESKIRES